jgi:cytochrome b6-f complex iron-sulfur subunit
MDKQDTNQRPAFPIRQRDEHQSSRREFGKFLGVAAVTCAGVAAGKAAFTGRTAAFEPFCICANDEIPVGGSRLFRLPGGHEPGILVRLSNGRLKAFSQSCTHLMCPVHFDAKGEQLVCPCHEGFFDARDGGPLAGPPRRALPQYQLELRGVDIWLHSKASSATENHEV